MELSKTQFEAAPEIGSLIASSPGESHFIGSSSGVYFIDTVKRAFDSSAESRAHMPAAVETIEGLEDEVSTGRRPGEETNIPNRTLHVHPQAGTVALTSAAELAALPPKDIAQLLVTEYFRYWHPLAPFLAGLQVFEELEALYSDASLFTEGHWKVDRLQLCRLITFRCVFDIAAADVDPGLLPPTYKAVCVQDVFSSVVTVANRHDVPTIQTVLAAQLLCVNRMALRTASSLGGLLMRLIMHAGLHRCPFRYAQISAEERNLRKRIFWSAYALDRFISQALGLPLAISDSDTDVCMPTSKEKHRPGSRTPRDELANLDQSDTRHQMSTQFESEADTEHNMPRGPQRETVLESYVDYCRLVGRAVELYHKSIHVRSIKQDKALFLRSDIDHWFNNLPENLQVLPFQNGSGQDLEESKSSRFAMFFLILYQQLIILVTRPSLSLHRTLPEFQSGLQTTLVAARATLTALEHLDRLRWPGYVSTVWMSGLIIAFACQVELYDYAKGSQEISRCVTLLRGMGSRWPTANRCCTALATLLGELQKTSFGRHEILMPTSYASNLESKRRRSAAKQERTDDDDGGTRYKQRPRREASPSESQGADSSSVGRGESASRTIATPTLSLASQYSQRKPSAQMPPRQLHQAYVSHEDLLSPGVDISTDTAMSTGFNDLFQVVSWENLFDFTAPVDDPRSIT